MLYVCCYVNVTSAGIEITHCEMSSKSRRIVAKQSKLIFAVQAVTSLGLAEIDFDTNVRILLRQKGSRI